MISGFLTSVIASDHASISRNALRWLLISTIFSAFLAAKRFDKRTIDRTDVADKHARYVSKFFRSGNPRRSRMN